MEVYLVQHGEAKPKEEDANRPLTSRGRREVSLVSSYVAGVGIRVAQIFHSGKLRARETAQIFAEQLHLEDQIKEIENLNPLADPQLIRSWIEEEREPILLVGHLPHLSRLLSLLILNDPHKEIVKFRMGGIVSLDKGEGKWGIKWILTPELIKKD